MYHPAKGEAAADAAEVVVAMNPGQLENLRIESLESTLSESDFADNELIERFKRREGELWGFEDRIEYAVVYELDGVRFDGGVTMARHDGKWFIATLNSRFANAPVFSGVRRRE